MTPLPKTTKPKQARYRKLLAKYGGNSPLAARHAIQGRIFLTPRENPPRAS